MKIQIEMPKKLVDSLKWLSTQKDSKGNKHSVDEIVVGAVNLFLMGIQATSDSLKNKN